MLRLVPLNDRAIQDDRAVATTDITTAGGESGRAVEVDHRLTAAKVDAKQPNPAVRMATALFNYSLSGRAQGRRGATKAELLAAIMLPADGPTQCSRLRRKCSSLSRALKASALSR
jgi:hypothetical protein